MPAPRSNDTQLGGITELSLLAEIKPGLVDAYETASYLDRLRKLLRTLNGLRLAGREALDPASPYSDVVARWRIVHGFRWVIVEGDGGAPNRLLLNVNFDGGWEPYMRVIWDQLGSTLDLILCHVEGYTLSNRCSFEAYAAWVRAHEVSADFIFLESGRSVSDAEYLKALEASQRGAPDALAAVRLRSPASGQTRPLPSEPRARFAFAARGLAPLAALYALARYFGPGAPDGDCLLRATQDILFELRQLGTLAQFPVVPLHPLRARYFEMLAWFERELRVPVSPQRQLPADDGALQAGMLSKLPADRGALVLLRVAQPQAALAWLSLAPVSHEGATESVWRQIALSLQGLVALGVPEARLVRFPQAFKEGMAARAGLLGDLRHNHPRQWRWPTRADGRGRIEPETVHVLVQLRFASAQATALDFDADDESRLAAAVAELTRGTGLALLGVEKLRSNPLDQENFGFKDGISQPQATPDPAARAWSDAVPRGELLQGYPTLRDQHYPVPEKADALLDQGSFLVVRKLRQFTARLDARMAAEASRLGLDAELLRAKLMGRWRTGEPLAAPGASNNFNDFNYAGDAQGARCPVHAHIRRANPRELTPNAGLANPMPRLLRRGMSYGPPADGSDAADRGLVFMAYNAHLAEQFEVIQRWMAGANASGGYSGQPDPLLAVVDPLSGNSRRYPFEHNGVVHDLDLGPDPFVTLQWGGYFFVPSIPALRGLPALAELPPGLPIPPPAATRAPDPADHLAWKRVLEDSTTREAAWAWVRQQPGGVLRTAYGVLVADPARVCEVLRNTPDRYSVAGYGRRMARSIGLGFLGMDEDSGHAEQAPRVNAAIEAIGEREAFDAAYSAGAAVLGRLRAEGLAMHQREVVLDLERYSQDLLAALCRHWFGLPDEHFVWGTEWHAGSEPPAPRCPAALFAVSRYVFGPEPSQRVIEAGEHAGQVFLKAVQARLAQPGRVLPELAQRIVAASPAQPATTLAGVMLGFPPTTHANLLTTLVAWVTKDKLWALQGQWLDAPAPRAHSAAVALLRHPLIATLNLRPTPFQLWREVRAAHALGGVALSPGDKLIVGLGSATQGEPRLHHLVFGGDRADPEGAPPHACPGYAMGMGVMLGALAALMDGGVLRGTGAPTSVLLATD